jgi:CO dehydrogenase maturation factor
VVQKLAHDLGIGKVKIIGNKIRREEEKDFIRQSFSEADIIGFLPYQEGTWEKSMEENPAAFSDKDLLTGVEEVYQEIVKEAI